MVAFAFDFVGPLSCGSPRPQSQHRRLSHCSPAFNLTPIWSSSSHYSNLFRLDAKLGSFNKVVKARRANSCIRLDGVRSRNTAICILNSLLQSDTHTHDICSLTWRDFISTQPANAINLRKSVAVLPSITSPERCRWKKQKKTTREGNYHSQSVLIYEDAARVQANYHILWARMLPEISADERMV